ncbi:MAG: hypothetical protein ACXWDL_09100 [Nocardioides sp.]
MNARLSLRAALLALALVAPLAALSPPGVSSAAVSASLRVTPGDGYVGGQAMRFQGNIGSTGTRSITMEFHMNRPGDGWGEVQDFQGSTQADGDFDFTFKAPSMFGIRYRVVSGQLATPPVAFNSRTQDLTVEVIGRPLAGTPFDLEVDTTPDNLFRRPDTKGLQPYVGRALTLQRRLGDGTWEKVDTSDVGQYGMGYFRNVTVTNPGTVVYRVIQENWTSDGNKIGWFPSFPTYVDVRDATGATNVLPSPVARASHPMPEPLPRSGVAANTASQRFGWAPSLFDFAWEFGESLTSPAHRGSNVNGWWLDSSDGGGRVGKHNGGLMLDSKRDNGPGAGDFGTTSATLRGLPLKYGRWETRLRIQSDESSARDYRVLVQLVPDNLANEDCGARTITVAQVAPHTNEVVVGVNAVNKKWTRTVPNVTINNQAIAFAVEVSRSHITWFLEGEPVATVKSRAAVSDVPLTLRMSMAGNGQQEMNHTRVISDWERGFTMARGEHVRSGPAMTQRRYSAPAC